MSSYISPVEDGKEDNEKMDNGKDLVSRTHSVSTRTTQPIESEKSDDSFFGRITKVISSSSASSSVDSSVPRRLIKSIPDNRLTKFARKLSRDKKTKLLAEREAEARAKSLAEAKAEAKSKADAHQIIIAQELKMVVSRQNTLPSLGIKREELTPTGSNPEPSSPLGTSTGTKFDKTPMIALKERGGFFRHWRKCSTTSIDRFDAAKDSSGSMRPDNASEQSQDEPTPHLSGPSGGEYIQKMSSSDFPVDRPMFKSPDVQSSPTAMSISPFSKYTLDEFDQTKMIVDKPVISTPETDPGTKNGKRPVFLRLTADLHVGWFGSSKSTPKACVEAVPPTPGGSFRPWRRVQHPSKVEESTPTISLESPELGPVVAPKLPATSPITVSSLRIDNMFATAMLTPQPLGLQPVTSTIDPQLPVAKIPQTGLSLEPLRTSPLSITSPHIDKKALAPHPTSRLFRHRPRPTTSTSEPQLQAGRVAQSGVSPDIMTSRNTEVALSDSYSDKLEDFKLLNMLHHRRGKFRGYFDAKGTVEYDSEGDRSTLATSPTSTPTDVSGPNPSRLTHQRTRSGEIDWSGRTTRTASWAMEQQRQQRQQRQQSSQSNIGTRGSRQDDPLSSLEDERNLDIGIYNTRYGREKAKTVMPEHLANSPLCPRNRKHASGGTGFCPFHGRRGVEREADLRL